VNIITGLLLWYLKYVTFLKDVLLLLVVVLVVLLVVVVVSAAECNFSAATRSANGYGMYQKCYKNNYTIK
jgi:hypothetical protein